MHVHFTTKKKIGLATYLSISNFYKCMYIYLSIYPSSLSNMYSIVELEGLWGNIVKLLQNRIKLDSNIYVGGGYT